MTSKTKVFVSATSGDLGTVRKEASGILARMDCEPIDQASFPPDYRKIHESLQDKIVDCDLVIHIVGFRYGGEPKPEKRPEGKQRRSWTQLEYDIARQHERKLYVFLCTEDFPFDTCASEPKDVRDLQLEHRNVIKESGHAPFVVESSADLYTKLGEIQPGTVGLQEDVKRLRTGMRMWSFLAVAAVLIAFAVVIYTGWFVPEKTAERVRQLQETNENSEQVVERLRASIRDRAENDLQDARNNEADWKVFREIEQRRDWELKNIDQLNRTLQKGLAGEADAVFKEAYAVLAREGIDAVIGFLGSHKEGILTVAKQQNERELEARTEKWKVLEPLLLLTNSLAANMDWGEARENCETVVSAAPDWSRAQQALGDLLHHMADFGAAEPHLKSALKLAEDEEQEASACHSLARLYHEQGRWDEAEELIRRALAINTQLHGEDDHQVATNLNVLSQILWSKNQLAETERVMRRALTIDEKLYPPDHPNIAIRLNNLAQLLRDIGNLSEAEPMMRQAAQIDEGFFGSSDPRVAIDLYNLALLLQARGAFNASELLLRRALAIDTLCYGKSHPKVASDLNSMAWLLQITNRLAKAEPLYRRAIAINEESFGPDDFHVAITLEDLSSLLQNMNRLAEAKLIVRRALDINMRFYGNVHPSVATSLSNLSHLLQATNRHLEAEPLIRRAIAIDEQSYGADGLNVAIRLNNLAWLLREMNRPAEAELLMRRALAIDEQNGDPDRPDVARNLNNLGKLLMETDRPLKAEPLLRRALTIDIASFGTAHVSVARDLNNLGRLLNDTNRPRESEPLLRRALTIDETSYGPRHPNVARDLDNLAQLLRDTDRLKQAEVLMRRCVRIMKQIQFDTGFEHTLAKKRVERYRLLLSELKLPPDEIGHRVPAPMKAAAPWAPIASEVEKLLGPARSIDDVLTDLDRQYRLDENFTSLDRPITPHLDKHLKTQSADLHREALSAYDSRKFADAIVLWQQAENRETEPGTADLSNEISMYLAAALCRLGDVELARTKLQQLLSELAREISPKVLGQSQYYLAVCHWQLGDHEAAMRAVEESLELMELVQGDATVPDPILGKPQILQQYLESGRQAPAQSIINVANEIRLARDRFEARNTLADLPLNEPVNPLLDEVLGPANSPQDVLAMLDKQDEVAVRSDKYSLPSEAPITPNLRKLLGPTESVQQVLDALDQQYRDEGRSETWFLPLDEPISPFLEETLGPIPKMPDPAAGSGDFRLGVVPSITTEQLL